MRAAVLTEVNQPLQILDLEQEPPKANVVRVQAGAPPRLPQALARPRVG